MKKVLTLICVAALSVFALPALVEGHRADTVLTADTVLADALQPAQTPATAEQLAYRERFKRPIFSEARADLALRTDSPARPGGGAALRRSTGEYDTR